MLDNVNVWCHNNSFNLNAVKCEVVSFSVKNVTANYLIGKLFPSSLLCIGNCKFLIILSYSSSSAWDLRKSGGKIPISTGSPGRGVDRTIPDMSRIVLFNCMSMSFVWGLLSQTGAQYYVLEKTRLCLQCSSGVFKRKGTVQCYAQVLRKTERAFILWHMKVIIISFFT